MLLITLAPSAGYAMGIGDVVLLSDLGEPLYATVDMQLGKGERLDDSCLSLSAVDLDGVAGSGAQLQSKLTYKFIPVTHNVEIRSRLPFNEPFVILRLQVKCQGITGSRTLTLLPQFAVKATTQAAISVPGKSPPATHATRHQQNTAVRVAALPAAITRPALPQQDKQATTEAVLPKQDKPAAKVQGDSAHLEKNTTSHSASAAAISDPRFRLRLSGEPLDLSRIGKLSAEERESILAQQRLLDEDDQTAHFLAMQHQLRLMQEEINKVRLKLARLEISQASATPMTVTAEPNANRTWRIILLLLGTIGAVSIAVFGLRYFAKSKKSANAGYLKKETLARPAMHQAMQTTNIFHPADSKQVSITEDIKPMSVVPPEKQSETDQLETEEHAVLEEAELYTVYGHADKGIRMLQEFVAKHPQSERAWMLLLSIYSSLGQAREFESCSRSFLSRNKDSSLWKTVQALGRTLEKGNPLYVDEKNSGNDAWLPSSPHQHHLIGAILIELGYLSIQDLANCLGEFDPKAHGRFGNYLLMRRMINHAQLNEALLKQQASSGSGLDSYGLPTLQQMEDLLKDFNPQRDGSVEDYLKERKSKDMGKDESSSSVDAPVIPEQPEKPLLEKKQDKTIPLYFALSPAKDIAFEAKQADVIAADKSMILEFDRNLLAGLAKDKPQEGSDTRVT